MIKETETNIEQNELDYKPMTIFCMKYELRNETFNLRTLLGTPRLPQSLTDLNLSSLVEVNGEMGFLISKQAQGALME